MEGLDSKVRPTLTRRRSAVRARMGLPFTLLTCLRLPPPKFVLQKKLVGSADSRHESGRTKLCIVPGSSRCDLRAIFCRFHALPRVYPSDMKLLPNDP